MDGILGMAHFETLPAHRYSPVSVAVQPAGSERPPPLVGSGTGSEQNEQE